MLGPTDLKKIAGRPSGPLERLIFNLRMYLFTICGVKNTGGMSPSTFSERESKLIIPLSSV